MDHLSQTRRPGIALISKKKTTCRLVDFAELLNLRVKIKGSKKMDKYLDLARELKRLLNMRVTVIPIIDVALGIVHKCLEKILEELEFRGRIETIQTSASLKSARISKRVSETGGDLLSFRLLQNLMWQGANINNNNNNNNCKNVGELNIALKWIFEISLFLYIFIL